MEQLYGKVVSLPRKKAGQSTKPKGEFLVTRGERSGQKVKFMAPFELMRFLRLRIMVCATGEWDGQTFLIADVRDVTRDLTTEDIEALSIIAPQLTNGVIKEALNALEIGRTGELIDLMKSEKENIAQKLAEGIGDESAFYLMKELEELTRDADILDVHNLFRKTCTSLDFEHALVAVDKLHRRAALNKKSVYELIKNHPWVLGQVFDEDGLVAANIIAKYLGVDYEVSKCRGRIIAHLLRDSRQGHAYTPSNHIYAGLKDFDKKTIDEAFNIIRDFQARKKNGYFVPETKHLTKPIIDDLIKAGINPARASKMSKSILLPKVIQSEKYIAKKTMEIINNDGVIIESNELLKRISKLAAEEGIEKLDAEQLKIAESLCDNKITVVTGEAGSGKTTTVKLIVKAIQEMLVAQIPVLAPTGRAAQIVGAETGANYSTIHRWARIMENETDLVVDEITGKIEEEEALAPVLIVDEMSMAEVTIFAKMLSACSSITRLVLLGDPAQLPAIGPSGVFQSLIDIASEKRIKNIELVELKHNYRVTKSGVIQNALRIRQGLNVDETLPDISLIEAKTQKKIIQETADIVKSLLDEGVSWNDIMVLGTTRTRGISVEALNGELRRKFGAKPFENIGLASDDPVIATRNDYEDGGIPRGLSPARRKKWKELRANRVTRPTVYNGTKGTVAGLSDAGDEIEIIYNMPEGNVPATYKVSEIPYYFELAYATTVHKSQGGQAKYVILACSTSVSRNMLYTAVTRCKNGKVWLVGPREIWDEAVTKDVSRVRSKLKYRIMEEAGLITEIRPHYPKKGEEYHIEYSEGLEDFPEMPNM